MITEQDLNAAIAECMGEREPNANTCIKLAAYITIKNELYGKADNTYQAMPFASFSSAPAPARDVVRIDSTTDFARAINGKSTAEAWAMIDDLVSTLGAIYPRLYHTFMNRLQ